MSKKGSVIRKSSTRKEIFLKGKFKFDADFDEFKSVIKLLNTYRCEEVVKNEEGYSMPNNIGRIIILGVKPKVKSLYSMTNPGTRISNLHSFGWIYRVFHKERWVMRYPELFRYRPHRQNIKMPIHDAVVTHGKSFMKHSDLLIQ